MIASGATVTDADFTTAPAYVIAQYGRVNVNKAPADEIAEVLELPLKDAEPIVKYRRDKAPSQTSSRWRRCRASTWRKLKKKKDAISFLDSGIVIFLQGCHTDSTTS